MSLFHVAFQILHLNGKLLKRLAAKTQSRALMLITMQSQTRKTDLQAIPIDNFAVTDTVSVRASTHACLIIIIIIPLAGHLYTSYSGYLCFN